VTVGGRLCLQGEPVPAPDTRTAATPSTRSPAHLGPHGITESRARGSSVPSVTLLTVERAVRVLGKKLHIEMVEER